jgi:hypothetical protein
MLDHLGDHADPSSDSAGPHKETLSPDQVQSKIASGILMTKYVPGEDVSLVRETTSMPVDIRQK